jgi:hypothetical protein
MSLGRGSVHPQSEITIMKRTTLAMLMTLICASVPLTVKQAYAQDARNRTATSPARARATSRIDGPLRSPDGIAPNLRCGKIVVQAGGKPLLVGYSGVDASGVPGPFALRLAANGGGVDPTYGNDGETLITFDRSRGSGRRDRVGEPLPGCEPWGRGSASGLANDGLIRQA